VSTSTYPVDWWRYAGYAVAGGVAAAAIASWTVYWLHRRKVMRLSVGSAAAAVTPLRGGAAVAGAVSF
jgi:hypothetical protein